MIDYANQPVIPHGGFCERALNGGNMGWLEQYLSRYGRPLGILHRTSQYLLTTPKNNHPVREEPLASDALGRPAH